MDRVGRGDGGSGKWVRASVVSVDVRGCAVSAERESRLLFQAGAATPAVAVTPLRRRGAWRRPHRDRDLHATSAVARYSLGARVRARARVAGSVFAACRRTARRGGMQGGGPSGSNRVLAGMVARGRDASRLI